jgi:hypothetical protein
VMGSKLRDMLVSSMWIRQCRYIVTEKSILLLLMYYSLDQSHFAD